MSKHSNNKKKSDFIGNNRPQRKINNGANYVPPPGELNDLASETVPNQSMSVQEMVERYNSGLPMRGQKVPIYNGDEPLPDISNLDLADAQAITEAIADQLADVKGRITAAKSIAENKAEIERIEKLVQERLKKIQDEAKPKPNTQE